MVDTLRLSASDQARLAGDCGPAQRFAMQLLLRVARNNSADRLIDISHAHLVGSYHSGPANLQVLAWLQQQRARVAIPTTLNASTEDLLQAPAEPASQDYRHTCEVVQYYRNLGCELTLTCAPYHLPRQPGFGDAIAWAESNAVVFANSVLGARSNMTPQYLDLCAALTGRMPAFGLYLEHQRAGQRVYQLDNLPAHWLADDAFYQLLGLHIGRDCGRQIPVLLGLPATATKDQLRSLGAAAACAGAVQMFHAVGLTPEAPSLSAALQEQAASHWARVGRADILAARRLLGGEQSLAVRTVCLGTPHFSLAEFHTLITLLAGRTVRDDMGLVVSTSRHTLAQLGQQADDLRRLGVQLVADRCCYYPGQLATVRSPVLTNSAKWAYYGPANLGVETGFARLASCVAVATGGRADEEAFWND